MRFYKIWSKIYICYVQHNQVVSCLLLKKVRRKMLLGIEESKLALVDYYYALYLAHFDEESKSKGR